MDPLPLEEAVLALKRDPTRAVVARVGGLTVELRTVGEARHEPGLRTVGEALRGIEWHGTEITEELLAFFAEARREGGGGHVPAP